MHLPVGDYLYKMKFAFDSKIRSLNARDCKMMRDLAECQYVGPTSQRLLNRLKERGLKQVFDFLDEDKVFSSSLQLYVFNICLLITAYFD